MSLYRPSPSYPINWNSRRQAVFKAMRYICQLCGEYSEGRLHYHHIRPISCGGGHHPSNMVPVCNSCHSFIHSGKYKGMYLNLSGCGKKRHSNPY